MPGDSRKAGCVGQSRDLHPTAQSEPAFARASRTRHVGCIGLSLTGRARNIAYNPVKVEDGVPLVNAQEMSLRAELNSESSGLGSGCLFSSQASMPVEVSGLSGPLSDAPFQRSRRPAVTLWPPFSAHCEPTSAPPQSQSGLTAPFCAPTNHLRERSLATTLRFKPHLSAASEPEFARVIISDVVPRRNLDKRHTSV